VRGAASIERGSHGHTGRYTQIIAAAERKAKELDQPMNTGILIHKYCSKCGGTPDRREFVQPADRRF
jgi:hypothetical protein